MYVPSMAYQAIKHEKIPYDDGFRKSITHHTPISHSIQIIHRKIIKQLNERSKLDYFSRCLETEADILIITECFGLDVWQSLLVQEDRGLFLESSLNLQKHSLELPDT